MTTPRGLIGLGVLGSIFAGNLAAGGDGVIAYDADPARRDALADARVRVVGSCAEVAAEADEIVLALPHPAAVRAAVTGPEGLLAQARPGSLIVDTSTIDPDTARAMDAAVAAAGGAYLEAPLSGGEPHQAGVDGARAATVTFMCGGSASAYERAQPALRLLGSHSFHLGDAGAGSEVKLISNMCSGLYALVAAEAFAAGAALGHDPERLLEVFARTDARSFFMTDYLLPRLLGDRLEPGFAVRLQLKDHRLLAALARRRGLELALNDHAVAAYERTVEAGDAERDVTIVLRRALDAT